MHPHGETEQGLERGHVHSPRGGGNFVERKLEQCCDKLQREVEVGDLPCRVKSETLLCKVNHHFETAANSCLLVAGGGWASQS